MSGEALAAAAEALVGARYRLHGRDPATGLDCIGVLAAALTTIGRPAVLPTGYRLRARVLPSLEPFVGPCGFAPCEGAVLPGDVLMLRVGPCQHHLVVAARGGFVHAHAGLRRVVKAPLIEAPAVGRWRLI